MKVMPQTVDTPRGHILGWKAVREERDPIYRFVDSVYAIGTTHVAYDSSYVVGKQWKFKSARKLRRLRTESLIRFEDCSGACLPGIHVCKTVKEALDWCDHEFHMVIPVAYSPKSVVGKKGADVIVVYRIKVLG